MSKQKKLLEIKEDEIFKREIVHGLAGAGAGAVAALMTCPL